MKEAKDNWMTSVGSTTKHSDMASSVWRTFRITADCCVPVNLTEVTVSGKYVIGLTIKAGHDTNGLFIKTTDLNSVRGNPFASYEK